MRRRSRGLPSEEISGKQIGRQRQAETKAIFRQSLDPASAYADLAIHGDGHATIQYRLVSGGVTGDVVAPQHAPARLRIERKGNVFTTYTGSADGKLTAFSSVTVVMDGPVYVGIGFCAHKADALASATFSNVTIEQAGR